MAGLWACPQCLTPDFPGPPASSETCGQCGYHDTMFPCP